MFFETPRGLVDAIFKVTGIGRVVVNVSHVHDAENNIKLSWGSLSRVLL